MSIVEPLWKLVAYVVTRPCVRDRLIARAQRTPYFHLDGYMDRWTLFNEKNETVPWLPWLRIHHIKRADHARDEHNHPWDARTIILKKMYVEKRGDTVHVRKPGDTASLQAGEFHHIVSVSQGGVWTLFIAWRWQHVWGFRTADGFVPWRKYLGLSEGEEG